MSTDAWAIVVSVILVGLGNAGLLIYKLGGIEAWKISVDSDIRDLKNAVWPGRAAQPQRSMQA